MSQPRRSTTAGPVARAAASPSGQQRRHPADDLALAIRDAERLEREFRHGVRDARHLHDLEERAHAVAQAMVAPFRGAGAKPSALPLHISPSGLSAFW
jgi:hypothetical protein